VVNRVGDFGFIIGIMAIYFLTDSIRFDDIFAAGRPAGRDDRSGSCGPTGTRST
jgi:NADH:ubiquinone oxidoreductase subunit 5 (subunit L)/multisubunit Na+/H+ antiporter MnhA subunit